MQSSIVFTLWLLNIVLDAGGQLAFKAAAMSPDSGNLKQRWLHMAARPWIWVGVICFVFEFVVWLAFLSLVPLAEGILLGMINIVVVMLAGRWLFGEKLSPMRVLGVCLIALGVAIVGGA
jgi:drug/metabolite transporter (DMT)-like permease